MSAPVSFGTGLVFLFDNCKFSESGIKCRRNIEEITMSQFNSDVPSEPFKTSMPTEQPPSGGKRLAVSSLVLGICGLIPLLGFFTAILGITLGAVSLVKRRAGTGLAIGGIVTGSVGIMIMLAQLIAFAILLPSISFGSVEDALQVSCRYNLHAIGHALQMYSVDKDGKFPPNLQVLVSGDYIESDAFFCPSAEQSNGKESGSDYFYLPPSSAGDDPMKIIACDLKSNHKGGRNVLKLDGCVEFLSDENFRWELEMLPCNSAFAEALRQKER